MKMKRCTVLFGLICGLIAGVQPAADEYVKVGEDVTVKPTPSGAKGKDIVNVTLTCTGSKTDLSYYIHNSVSWIFIDSEGTENALTKTFYPADNEYAKEHFGSKRYVMKYAPDEAQGDKYAFKLIITGVTDADNGVYKCALLGQGDVVKHEESLRLTVARDIELMEMKLYGKDAKVLKTSRTFSTSGDAVQLLPGTYEVKCTASGSNPAATMTFMMDENNMQPDVSHTKMVKEGREMHTSAFKKSITVAHSEAEQTLVCGAQVPGNMYSSKSASINMLVQVHTPAFSCANTSAVVGNRYVKLSCNVSMPDGGALDCSLTGWTIGDSGIHIKNNARNTDKDGQYDITEHKCEKVGSHVHVTLNIYLVKDAHFDTVFYITYGNEGSQIHRYPVYLGEKVSAAACLSTVSLLAAVLMAMISRVVVNVL